MPYWQLYYHIVWTTRQREPLLDAANEGAIQDWIRSKAVGLGATVHAVNSMPDHVHLVVSVPPRLALATFVGQVKGVTSAQHNKAHPEGPKVYWQEEYSVFSFDHKALAGHVSYVLGQKEHHARGTAVPLLERVPDDETGHDHGNAASAPGADEGSAGR